jgi:methylase of polypeptide subunit release factors
MAPSPPVIRRCTARFGPVEVDYDERVLAPRQWTLAHSEWAAELAADAAPGRILELCAGAGHIGLAAAVLADRPLLQVEADPVASDYARFNAARAGWGPRTEVRTAALVNALHPGEGFGLLIADPPYLCSDAVACWPEDPVAAIDGGADGLDLITSCLVLGGAHLRRGGHLLLQVAGPAQADQVEQLLCDDSTRWALVSGERRIIDDRRAIVQLSRR